MDSRGVLVRVVFRAVLPWLLSAAAVSGGQDQAVGSLPPLGPPISSGTPTGARAMDGPLTGVLMLYASLAGNGSGRITSDPSGIDCPGACLALFASGTKVTLQASAGAGSSFETWLGDCTGNGGCELTMSVNRSVTASFRGADCTASIAPTSASFGADGGSGSLSVSAPPGCSWTAASQASWLAVTSGASGSGAGTVAYSAATNPGPGSRSGTLSVAGHAFVVAQQAPATIAVDFLYTQVVAAVAHKPGLLGTSWLSDLVLHNPGTSDTAASLIFLEEKQDNSHAAARQTRVPAGASVKVADVVGAVFGETSSGGALLVGSDRPLVVSSRTYNDASAGTYGQYIRGIPLEQAHGSNQEVRLIGLQQNATYRTNVGFVNATGSSLDLAVDYVRADGVPIGTRGVSLPPWGYAQESEVIGKLTSASIGDAYALIRTSTAGARFLAYASVVDNRTGDPVLVLPVGTGTAASGTSAQATVAAAETGVYGPENVEQASPQPVAAASSETPPPPHPAPTDQTVERWVPIGPGGCDPMEVAFDPFDPSVVYVGTNGAGLFRSSDGGATWRPTGPSSFTSVPGIAFDPSRPGVVYAASWSRSVFKTEDGGSTWKVLQAGITDWALYAVAVSPSDPKVLYLGAERTIYRSSDGGSTWSVVGSNLGVSYVHDIAVHPTDPNTVFIGFENGFLKTTDGGHSWASVPSFSRVMAIAFDPSDSRIVYAGGYGVSKSIDRGLTWEPLAGLSSGLVVLDIAIAKTATGTVYVASSSDGLWASSNGGASWKKVAKDWPVDWATSVTVSPADPKAVVIGLFYHGMYRTTDGGLQWYEANAGLQARVVDAISVHRTSAGQLLAAADYQVFRTIDGGASWSTGGYVGYIIQFVRSVSNPLVLYTAGWGSQVFRSTDGGVTWTGASNGLPRDANIGTVAVDPTDSSVVYAVTHNKGLYRSTDGAASWQAIGDGVSPPDSRSLLISPLDRNTLYAASLDAGIFRSRDGGITWTTVNSGLQGTWRAVLAMHPVDPHRLFVGLGRRIYHTLNGGDSWSELTQAPLPFDITSLTVSPEDPAVLLLGTYSGGIFRSLDGGRTWSPLSEGLGSPSINDLTVSGAVAYAATNGRSVFKLVTTSCTFGLSSSAATFGPLGGKGSFSVATPAGCQWTAGTEQNWIAVTRGGGTGEGIVEFTVTANPTSGSRTGTITAGGQTFTVTQTGCAAPAVPALTAPASASSGTSYTVSWTATSPDGQYEIEEATRADFAGAARLTVTGTRTSFQHAVSASTTYRYRVRAIVTCAGGTQASGWSSPGQTVVQGTAGGVAWWVPAAAHVGGVAGTDWRTDLEVHNAGAQTLSLSMTALKRDQANPSPSPHGFQLAGGRSQRFEDVLAGVFGMDGAAALRLVPTSGAVMVTSRTYNNQPGGTYGQFIAGVVDDDAVPYGRSARLVQLSQSASSATGYRTNLGVVNATASSLAVEVVLYRGDGTKLGSTVVTLAGYEYRQVDRIFTTVTSGEVSDGYAVLRTPTPGGRFFAYASVVDNRSGDPIYVPAQVVAAGQ